MNEIGAFNPQVMAQNIRSMNDMLKAAMGAELEFSNKMIRAEVTAQVQGGPGENLDVFG
jgi:hypothetical protein